MALVVSNRSGDDETVVMAHVLRTWLSGRTASDGAAQAPEAARWTCDDESELRAVTEALSGTLECMRRAPEAYRREQLRCGRIDKRDSRLSTLRRGALIVDGIFGVVGGRKQWEVR